MLKSYKKTGEGIGNRNQSPTQIEIQKNSNNHCSMFLNVH